MAASWFSVKTKRRRWSRCRVVECAPPGARLVRVLVRSDAHAGCTPLGVLCAMCSWPLGVLRAMCSCAACCLVSDGLKASNDLSIASYSSMRTPRAARVFAARAACAPAERGRHLMRQWAAAAATQGQRKARPWTSAPRRSSSACPRRGPRQTSRLAPRWCRLFLDCRLALKTLEPSRFLEPPLLVWFQEIRLALALSLMS